MPRQAATWLDRSAEAHYFKGAMARKKKLLVVDDDDMIREALKALLAEEGFEIETAENGDTAMKKCCSGYRPDLILLDLMMPVKSGVMFRQEQLAQPEIRHVPVIVLSAGGGMLEQAKKLHGATILAKPVDVDALLGAVARAIK